MRKPGLFLRSPTGGPRRAPCGRAVRLRGGGGCWRFCSCPACLAACLLDCGARPSPRRADEGETLATEKCSDCHAVTSESYAGPLPTLYEIAAESRYWDHRPVSRPGCPPRTGRCPSSA